MIDGRTLALGAAVFSATFAGAWWWLGMGKAGWALPPVPGITASVPAPAAEWPDGPGLTQSDLLRRSVVQRSKAYLRPSCNADNRTLYVVAATNYAEILMRAAGCHTFPACPLSEPELNKIWRANRSVLDKPVAEAMAEVHQAGGLTVLDFRGDVSHAVRVIAGTHLRGGPMPKCEDTSGRSSAAGPVQVRRR
jgi:hypothetical protein